jgi:hypothetical protein
MPSSSDSSSVVLHAAHFKKVKDAIEKEYFLLMLSQPRSAAPAAPKPPVEASLPALSQLMHYAYGTAGGSSYQNGAPSSSHAGLAAATTAVDDDTYPDYEGAGGGCEGARLPPRAAPSIIGKLRRLTVDGGHVLPGLLSLDTSAL